MELDLEVLLAGEAIQLPEGPALGLVRRGPGFAVFQVALQSQLSRASGRLAVPWDTLDFTQSVSETCQKNPIETIRDSRLKA
jgi:hypothetical protein